MAWQRTIPFGYQMRQGKIETNATEADTVKGIFAQYLQGESLQRIAETMTARGVRYHERTERWNKNMVKRILENGHYLGDALYPRVIDEKDFLAVQSGSAQRIANELTNALNRGAESIEYLRTLVFACAAERYNELPDTTPQYKLDKLRERLESGEQDKTIQQELLKTAVRTIRITDGDTITLELVNGQHIGKEAADV